MRNNQQAQKFEWRERQQGKAKRAGVFLSDHFTRLSVATARACRAQPSGQNQPRRRAFHGPNHGVAPAAMHRGG